MDYSDDRIPDDALVTVDQGAAFKTRTVRSDGRIWRWMGNFAGVYEAAQTANVPPACGAGEIMFQINANNTVAAWMRY